MPSIYVMTWGQLFPTGWLYSNKIIILIINRGVALLALLAPCSNISHVSFLPYSEMLLLPAVKRTCFCQFPRISMFPSMIVFFKHRWPRKHPVRILWNMKVLMVRGKRWEFYPWIWCLMFWMHRFWGICLDYSVSFPPVPQTYVWWEEGKMGCLWREVIVFMTAL